MARCSHTTGSCPASVTANAKKLFVSLGLARHLFIHGVHAYDACANLASNRNSSYSIPSTVTRAHHEGVADGVNIAKLPELLRKDLINTHRLW